MIKKNHGLTLPWERQAGHGSPFFTELSRGPGGTQTPLDLGAGRFSVEERLRSAQALNARGTPSASSTIGRFTSVNIFFAVGHHPLLASGAGFRPTV